MPPIAASTAPRPQQQREQVHEVAGEAREPVRRLERGEHVGPVLGQPRPRLLGRQARLRPVPRPAACAGSVTAVIGRARCAVGATIEHAPADGAAWRDARAAAAARSARAASPARPARPAGRRRGRRRRPRPSVDPQVGVRRGRQPFAERALPATLTAPSRSTPTWRSGRTGSPGATNSDGPRRSAQQPVPDVAGQRLAEPPAMPRADHHEVRLLRAGERFEPCGGRGRRRHARLAGHRGRGGGRARHGERLLPAAEPGPRRRRGVHRGRHEPRARACAKRPAKASASSARAEPSTPTRIMSRRAVTACGVSRSPLRSPDRRSAPGVRPSRRARAG